MDDQGAIGASSGAKAKRGAGGKPGVAWRTLRDWLALVESQGGLKRISAPVNADEELSAVHVLATQAAEDPPAMLFENIEGDRIGGRVLTNMLGASKERFALAMGFDPQASVAELVQAARRGMTRRLPPKMIPKSKAPVNEVVHVGDAADATIFPAPRFWPGDGGPYIGTGCVAFTRGPDSDRINVGCYRQMLHGPRRIGMYCSPGKGAKRDREAWWARGEPCEVVAAYGVDPVLFMVAGGSYRDDLSELEVAGGVMGEPVALTKAETVSLPIPAHAEIVIEGLLHPGDEEMEGPLGEFTGYYGNERGLQPVIEVTAVHHRKNPIVTAAVMAKHPSSELGTAFAIMRSARVLEDLERIGAAGVVSAYATPAAIGGYGLLAVSIKQGYPGHAAQILALASQCPAAAFFIKWVVVVDEDVDPTDLNQVLWAMSTRCHPADDVAFQRDTWCSPLDPSQFPPEERPFGSKALINACRPFRHLKHFPKATALRRETFERVAARWGELGFSGQPPTPVAFDDSADRPEK